MKCEKCGLGDDYLDWRVDDKGNMVWECFECEHTWEVPLKKN